LPHVEVYLETNRLLLRRLTDADAKNLFLLDSDPAVMRFINGGKATPRDVIETETLPLLLDSYTAGYGRWATIEKAAGVFVGWHGLPASRRVLEKAGLTCVRTFHESGPEPIEGTNEGDVEYALTRSAWAARAATKR
jgi:RimJ/RimL family protein N-acetyltransferase